MFNEIHQDPLWQEKINLAFAKSTNVKVYPSGRRRTPGWIDPDNDTQQAENEMYRIPFDPEARLNTEANNRKHSGVNGFTQTYLKDWSNNILELALGGYLFTIDASALLLETDSEIIKNGFGNTITGSAILNDSNALELYANVLLEEVQLFSGFSGDYFTEILRNQSSTEQPEDSLDLLTSAVSKSLNLEEIEKLENYYFSGLSFSTSALSGLADGEEMIILPPADSDKKAKQRAISLRILSRENTESDWKICETARLPKITHGKTPDSVKVHELVADAMSAEEFSAYNLTVTNHTKTKTLEVEDKIDAKTGVFDGDISAVNITADKTIEAKELVKTKELTAGKITQNGKPVPAISIKETNGYYQLQITTNAAAK